MQVGNHGVCAVVSALILFIHPSNTFGASLKSPVDGQHLLNCVTVQQEVKKVLREEQPCLVMHHKDFKNDDNTFIELYSVKRFWWVQQSSDPDLFFNQQAGGCNQEADEGGQIPIPMAVDDHLGGEWKFCEHWHMCCKHNENVMISCNVNTNDVMQHHSYMA